jgi:hypothetical protein
MLPAQWETKDRVIIISQIIEKKDAVPSSSLLQNRKKWKVF